MPGGFFSASTSGSSSLLADGSLLLSQSSYLGEGFFRGLALLPLLNTLSPLPVFFTQVLEISLYPRKALVLAEHFLRTLQIVLQELPQFLPRAGGPLPQ